MDHPSATEAEELEPIPDMFRFAIQHWYPIFRQLTLPTEFFDLCPAFVSFLLDEGPLILPPRYLDEASSPFAATLSSFMAAVGRLAGRSDPSVSAHVFFCFFPKAIFSAPQDAQWINPYQSMACETAKDVILMLKASAVVYHDIAEVLAFCEDKQLFLPAGSSPDLTAGAVDGKLSMKFALRRFVPDWQEGCEFRVFVRDAEIVAICQRDCSQTFEFLTGDGDAEAIRERITDLILDVFEDEHVCSRFGAPSFVFDVYLQIDLTQRSRQPRRGDASDSLLIVDFGPFHEYTNPLLFSWQFLRECELPSATESDPQFRIVDPSSSVRIRPSAAFLAGVPADLTSLSHVQQEAIERLAEDWKRMNEEEELQPQLQTIKQHRFTENADGETER